jgi:SAM-dependent methyltransferase
MNPKAYCEMAATEEKHWWFVGRRAILAYIIRSLDLPAGAKILEIGSGTGGNLQMLSAFGIVSAVEMDPAARTMAVRKTNAAFDVRSGNFPSAMPFGEEKFDLICLFDVLEHIEDDAGTLLAIKRLLAPEGRVVLTVPAYSWLWSAHDVFLHHKRRYFAKQLGEKINAAGLRCLKLTYFNTLLFPMVLVARLLDRLTRKTSSTGTTIPARPINKFLQHVFSAERFLLARFPLPFGVSLLSVIRSDQ